MQKAILKEMQIEGSKEVAAINYEDTLSGGVEITGVIVANRDVRHLLTQSQKLDVRRAVFGELSSRTFDQYRADAMAKLTEVGLVQEQTVGGVA